MQDFVNARNSGNPVPEASFYTELETYLQTSEGQTHFLNYEIGYYNKKLKFSRIQATSVEYPGEGYSTLYPVFEKWESLKDSYILIELIYNIKSSFHIFVLGWNIIL